MYKYESADVKIESMSHKVIATNRKAKFEFFLLDNFEAGIVLKGSEIKSIRAGHISINEAYVQMNGFSAWLIGANISPYDPASRENHLPTRERQLLLNKRELMELWEGIQKKGLTIVPVQVYLKNGRAKVNIALAKGKKLFDKRRSIADREIARELRRSGK
jgi:SsrA-binding protein